MATWAVKKDDGNETNERLIKRWKRQMNNSRVMLNVRNGRYFKKKLTKRQIREGAVISDGYRDENKRKAFYA
ncbi:TPA: 30S ribosomal protein S21 [Candidatus Gracilibacteria bacterium]|nr:30S ribosomal protein S21 [Candidatus Gracilibacteria bacterium]HIQ57316.1 30S ribosomal protein S21 [Candidatus Gracilibacteria bacterium]